jgi:hypothetical protein
VPRLPLRPQPSLLQLQSTPKAKPALPSSRNRQTLGVAPAEPGVYPLNYTVEPDTPRDLSAGGSLGALRRPRRDGGGERGRDENCASRVPGRSSRSRAQGDAAGRLPDHPSQRRGVSRRWCWRSARESNLSGPSFFQDLTGGWHLWRSPIDGEHWRGSYSGSNVW